MFKNVKKCLKKSRINQTMFFFNLTKATNFDSLAMATWTIAASASATSRTVNVSVSANRTQTAGEASGGACATANVASRVFE